MEQATIIKNIITVPQQINQDDKNLDKIEAQLLELTKRLPAQNQQRMMEHYQRLFVKKEGV